MNCKPGELAIVKSAHPTMRHLIGQIVLVTELSEQWDTPHWRTKPEFFYGDGALIVFDDSTLRPLRDNDGEDETLQWAPVPKDQKVPA